MRKIRKIFRLHYEQKLGQRQIARGANVSQSTVHEYLQRAQAASLSWPLPEEWDEERLEAALFPSGSTAARSAKHSLPDFTPIRKQFEQRRDLTKELLREESRAASGRYCYSRFCSCAGVGRSSRTDRDLSRGECIQGSHCSDTSADCDPAVRRLRASR